MKNQGVAETTITTTQIQRMDNKTKASHKFIVALAFVSILGFLGIMMKALFGLDLSEYVEAGWMIIIGIGLMLEGQVTKLKNLKDQGLTPTNFTHLITVIIGIIAIIAGIFTIPQLRIETTGFLAVKGIIALIAVVIIIIQTWVIE